MVLNQQTFIGEKKINYIYNRADWECPYLAVVFSAFNRMELGEQHPYHHLKEMAKFNVHQLFIQDTCGSRGCYYLCENLDFGVERTVKKLIDFVSNDAKVKEENIITIGSSKGGTAALYYGLKYGYGNVICGVPQVKIIQCLYTWIPGGGKWLILCLEKIKVKKVYVS